MRNTKKLHIFALAAHGNGLSGGDRIFIEFARRWQKKAKITIYVNEEGRKMCRRHNLLEGKNLKYVVLDTSKINKFGFVITYFYRIYYSIIKSFKIVIKNNSDVVLYSASDFWMDTLPCLILKLRSPIVKWTATWYQTAPNPFTGYSSGERKEKYRTSALFYWLSQFPVKPLISRFADFVLVNNEEERKQFPKLDGRGKTIVVLGAVDLKKIENFKLKIGNLPKVYDAVFQGRFHPQKGVVELIEIWRKVVDKIPSAKLAMIGDGPLMNDVRFKIQDLKLENNIKLFGYLFDGDEKYKIFSQSKIVVHPAFYDSGGMASAEAMAFDIPVIGFNLKAYDSYYPKGMLRAVDENQFVKLILKLLGNDKDRNNLGAEAYDFIVNNYSWVKRADEIYRKLRREII